MFTVNNVKFWNAILQAVHHFNIIFTSICSRVLLVCSSLLGLKEVEDIGSYLNSKSHRKEGVKPKSSVSRENTPSTLVNLEPECLSFSWKGNLFRHLARNGRACRESGTTFWDFFNISLLLLFV